MPQNIVLSAVRNIILSAIDFFHKPFARWINLRTFRYVACGGFNNSLNVFIFWFSYHFLYHEQPVSVGPLVITSYIASFLTAFSISFPLGFTFSKYIVFQESTLHGRVQLFRYSLLVMTCIMLNYVFLKVFVEWCHFYPTPSSILTTIMVAIFSYVSQRKFTFKINDAAVEEVAIPVNTD